jgi:hypothetical protein
MHAPTAAKHRFPYGLSFTIDDLIQVRSWATQHRLVMTVAIDQVLDSVEFEEMLLLAPPDRRQRAFTLWRTLGSIYAQRQGDRPRAFMTVAAALEYLHQSHAKRRSGWFSFLRAG